MPIQESVSSPLRASAQPVRQKPHSTLKKMEPATASVVSLPQVTKFKGEFKGDNGQKTPPTGIRNRIKGWFQSFLNWFKPEKKRSEVPDILPQQPKGFWGKLGHKLKAALKWFDLRYAIPQIINFFRKREVEKVLDQLSMLTTKQMEDIKNQAPLEKIDFAKPVRKTTGIAKASHFFGPDDNYMRHRRDFTFLNMADTYGLKWSPFKVVRDALQNFYDGQGQTLQGVETDVTPLGEGKHRIKVSASATYDVDKLLTLGGTGKHGSTVTAGGFGEGATMMTLALLRDYGARQVTFRSREWQADFKLAYPGRENAKTLDARALMVKLTPLKPPIQGNSLEFETTDPVLAASFENTDRLFYDPTHDIFKNPMYENEVGGFKLLDDKKAKGAVYEAGQLRAFGREDNYDAIPGMILWSNQKLLDLTDRDRVALQKPDVETILSKVVQGMSLEQVAQGIQVLRDHWFFKNAEDVLSDDGIRGDDKKAANIMLEVLCQRYAALGPKNKTGQVIKPDFIPEGLVAINPKHLRPGEEGLEQLNRLSGDGYLPVNESLRYLGVPDGNAILHDRQALLEAKASKVNQLTPREQRQLGVLSSGLNALIETRRGQTQGQDSFYRTYAEKVAELAALPMEVVTLPKQKNMDEASSFVRVSKDENRILVDRKVLSEKPFPEVMEALFNIAKKRDFWLDKATYPWLLGNPAHWQKLKADWDRKE